jgi:protein-S-isoprenylcysteine O-methyltransferase Ste14
MSLIYQFSYQFIWLTWVFYWWVVSRDVKSNLYKESSRSRLLHLIPLAVAFLLLGLPHGVIRWFNIPILPAHYWKLWFWMGAFITVSGLLFTVWARQYLGRNWSGAIAIKQNHQLITRGPYSLVRHPMYSGLLLAFTGTAISRGDLQGSLAIIMAFGTLLRKLHIEEVCLQKQFGDRFLKYAKHSKALIPFIL